MDQKNAVHLNKCTDQTVGGQLVVYEGEGVRVVYYPDWSKLYGPDVHETKRFETHLKACQACREFIKGV